MLNPSWLKRKKARVEHSGPRYRICISIQTGVDPCINCTKRKLDTGQGFWALWPRKIVCQLVVSACRWSCLLLTPLVLSPLAWSRGALGPLPGFSWASPGPLWGAISGLFAALGAPVLLGCRIFRLLGLRCQEFLEDWGRCVGFVL